MIEKHRQEEDRGISVHGQPVSDRGTGPLGYKLRLVFWETTAGCNLTCQHCRRLDLCGSGLAPGDMETEQCLQLVDSIAAFARPILVLSGGEPLIRPDIFQIADYAAEKNLPVALATNGTLIDDSLATRLGGVGNLTPTISLEGWSEHTDARRGLGVFDKTLEAMSRLRAAGVPFGVSLTATRDNAEEILGDLKLTYNKLRQASITTPIIVLGGLFRGQEIYAREFNLIPVIYTIESAQKLALCATASHKVTVHVKIDTGMGRIGVLPTETKDFFQTVAKLQGIEIGGILSHLADASYENNSGKEFTLRQIALFNQQIEELHEMGIDPQYKHLANSAAIIDQIPALFNLVRPGIMLYGSYPTKRLRNAIALKPVMKLISKITFLKKVPKGTPISYGRTFTCSRESLIATVPIGYADGYSRAFSNRGKVLIRERKAPIVGVVCMDMLMVDVTDIPGVSLGDEVILLGTQGTETITVADLAKNIGTIPYEVLCGIGPRVPRFYLKGGRILN